MRFIFAALFCSVALAGASLAASLTVRVGNIDPKGGLLHVALYNAAIWDDDNADPLMDRIVPAVAPETVVTFTKVPPGVYGVKSYQDVNRNDKFDQGLFGIPLERYGFSRDAHPRLSQPAFSRTQFTIPASGASIVLHLQ